MNDERNALRFDPSEGVVSQHTRRLPFAKTSLPGWPVRRRAASVLRNCKISSLTSRVSMTKNSSQFDSNDTLHLRTAGRFGPLVQTDTNGIHKVWPHYSQIWQLTTARPSVSNYESNPPWCSDYSFGCSDTQNHRKLMGAWHLSYRLGILYRV